MFVLAAKSLTLKPMMVKTALEQTQLPIVVLVNGKALKKVVELVLQVM